MDLRNFPAAIDDFADRPARRDTFARGWDAILASWFESYAGIEGGGFYDSRSDTTPGRPDTQSVAWDAFPRPLEKWFEGRPRALPDPRRALRGRRQPVQQVDDDPRCHAPDPSGQHAARVCSGRPPAVDLLACRRARLPARAPTRIVTLSEWVTPTGGDYFFAPSISTLRQFAAVAPG